jgi:hypothetical protein
MSGIKFANFSRRRPKVSDPNVGKLQSREDVVSPRAGDRSLGQSLLMVTAMTALSAQVLSENRPKRTGICAISHHHLHSRTKNKGTASHVNNVELGKNGRWRSNVWTYPGASSLGSDARRGLQDHPTVKPTALLKDALLDLSDRGAFGPFSVKAEDDRLECRKALVAGGRRYAAVARST